MQRIELGKRQVKQQVCCMVKDLKKSVKRTGFRHMENGLKTLLVSVVRDGSYAQACACHLHATVSSAVLVVAYASSLRSCSLESSCGITGHTVAWWLKVGMFRLSPKQVMELVMSNRKNRANDSMNYSRVACS